MCHVAAYLIPESWWFSSLIIQEYTKWIQVDSWTTARQLGDKLWKKGWWEGLGGKKSVAHDPPIVQTEIMKPRA